MTFPFPTFCPVALKPSEYIGFSRIGTQSGTITWPTGTVEGDIAIIVLESNTAPTISAGWTLSDGQPIQSPSTLYLSMKKLDAADVSSPPSYTGSLGYATVYVYRGGNSATIKKQVAAPTGSTLSLDGFIKASNSRKVVSLVCDRDPGSNPTAPSGMTSRDRTQATYFMMEAADIDPAGYINNASVGWTGFSATYGQAGFLVEITN
jgi:hypothetical protein